MSRWRIQKINSTGTVLNEWHSSAQDGSNLGFGSPFQWSTGRLGDLRELTFEVDLVQKPFALGEYVRLYADFNGDGTEDLEFTGLVTEIPGSNRGYAGTVRVSGLRRLLEGIPAPRKEYTGLITEPINDILALLPALVPVAVNESTTWTQQLEYWYAGHVSCAAALDDLVGIGGGTWSVADNGLNIRSAGYVADYAPTAGNYYLITGPSVKDEPYTAVRVRLNDVGGKMWANGVAEPEIYQTEQTKDVAPPPQFALGQNIITDATRHATAPYFISVGVGDIKTYESRVPTALDARAFNASGVLGTTVSHANTGYTGVDYTLASGAGVVFSPPASLFSATSAIVGCIYYMALDVSANATLAVIGAGGPKLPSSGSLGAHILNMADVAYWSVPTRAGEWSDSQQNGHTMAIVNLTTAPATPAQIGGELHTGRRDGAAIQPSASDMWQPMVLVRNISLISTTVTAYIYYEFFVTTTAMVEAVVAARAPVPSPYSIVVPNADPRRWLTVSAAGIPTFKIDHCEYTLSNEEGAITRMFSSSAVDPFISRQAEATIKNRKGRL